MSLTKSVSLAPAGEKSQKKTVPIVMVVLALTAFAIFIRLPGLGQWGMTIDEYYFSRSVEFILANGVPEFPGGGYYIRGIGLQYLAAGSALLFDDWEFALRLVPLIFGVLTVPLCYLVSRAFLAPLPAALCAFTLLLSSWHIEFSRFARMYSAFQFFFLAFLFFLHSGYWKKIRSHQIAAWLVALVSIVVYEGSIFLPFLLLLPLFAQDSRPTARQAAELILAAGLILGLNYLVHGVNYRFLGVENPFPGELASPGMKGPLELPRLALFGGLLDSFAFWVYLPLIVGAVFLVIRQARFAGRDLWVVASIGLAAFLPLFHQFGLLFFSLLLFFIGRRAVLEFFVRYRTPWLLYWSIVLAFWLGFGFLLQAKWSPDVALFGLLKNLANNLFRYPLIYDAVIVPFGKSIPVWSLFAALGILLSLLRHLFARNGASRFPLLVLLASVFLLGILETPYASTRYSFFLLPVVLLIGFIEAAALMSWASKRLPQGLPETSLRSLAFIPFAFFLMTEEFNFRHLLDVSSAEANFRMGRYEKLANHWYGRRDFEGPARFVNRTYAQGDVVVVDYVPSTAYLTVPFMNYIPVESQRFKDVARQGGTEEAWTGRPLVYELDALLALVPSSSQSSLWLIAVQDGSGGGAFKDMDVLVNSAQANAIHAEPVFDGIDKRIGVWRLNRRML